MMAMVIVVLADYGTKETVVVVVLVVMAMMELMK
jgi:hypothetical protein